MEPDAYDDLDRALVHALQIDGRAPFTRIGEVLDVSDQTVARRYGRLRRERVLQVVGIADPDVLHAQQWIVRVTVDPDRSGPVAEALARRADTTWINVCSGDGNIVCAVHASSAGPLLLDALQHSPHVRNVQADQVLHTFYGGHTQPFTKHGPLTPTQIDALARHVPPGDPSTPLRLDDIDHALLTALRHDGRVSAEDLAATVHISVSSVRRRIATLRQAGVLHLDVDVDVALLQLPARTMMWLTVTAAALDAAGRALAGHDETAYVAAVSGRPGLFASVVTPDSAGLFAYLTTAVAALPGVGTAETAIVLRHVKGEAVVYPPRASTSATAGRAGVDH